MPTTFERTWQHHMNQVMPITNTADAAIIWMKSFLKGDFTASPNQGLWTCDRSNDGATAGTAGDGIDRWSVQGGVTGLTGVAASIIAGATIVGAVRLAGVTGMTAASVGTFMTIAGAASPTNTSKLNTPWRVVQFNSATSVDIYNPLGVTGDGNNGAITWTNRTQYLSNPPLQRPPGNISWYVLRSPAAMGPYYLTLSTDGSAQLWELTVFLSKTQPSGGTANNRPTSVDEYGFTGKALIGSAPLTSWFWNGSLSTVGDFMFTGNRTTTAAGTGVFETVIIGQTLADTKAADLYKFVLYANTNVNASGATALLLSTPANWVGRNFNGGSNLTGLGTIELAVGTISVFSNAILGFQDFTDSKYDDGPLYVFNNQVGNFTLKGRLADIKRAPASLPEGFTEPNPTTPASMVVGNLWFPCNAAPVL